MTAKVTKETAHYRDFRKGEAMCTRCTMFRLMNKCTAVEGVISPFGWCEYFKAKVTKK